MSKFKVSISSIMGGISPGLSTGAENQFLWSLNIDPDLPDVQGGRKAAHALTPSSYKDFTDAKLNGAPMWLMTNPKNALLYAYCDSGRLVSYASALSSASETTVGTPTSGAGNGAAYYNNYLYLFTPTDVSRYGPLNDTATMYNARWTGAELGTQTALVNTTYPSFASVSYPNHPAHVHVDNRLYFGDFKNGIGYIHFIKTKTTTKEGDTNDGSKYNALDLPFGYAPIDIESWGSDVVILANSEGSDTTLIQGKSALFFWDTSSDSFYRIVHLPDPFGSSLLNNNGRLYIFSGNLNSGHRVSEYAGGYSVKTLSYVEYGETPFAGSVGAIGDRVFWGSRVTWPANASCMWSLGYKNMNLPALHNIINSDAVGGDSATITSAMYAQHASFVSPRVLVGWKDGVINYGIDKLSGTSVNNSYWISQYYPVPSSFKITKIILTLGKALAANMTIVPTLFFDHEATNEILTTINSTNYPNSETKVVLMPTKIGKNNFSLSLNWTGTVQFPVLLPIVIEGEILSDATE